jgi:hypothetical protein
MSLGHLNDDASIERAATVFVSLAQRARGMAAGATA